MFTTRVLIKTFTIAKGTRCSLTHSFFYLFVVRICFKGHLKGAGNNLRRIVNVDSWYVEPRSYRPCSRICYVQDRCYCFEYFVKPFVNSYVLFFLFVYEIDERLSGVFYCFLYIHRFGRFK